jgi:hypothetical protein
MTANRIGQATPGPWEARNVEDAPDEDIYIFGNPTWPCTQFGEEGVWDIARACELGEEHVFEQIANAHLIAAAPDMFEALAGMIGRYAKAGPFDELLGASEQTHETNAALAALARARGEQPAREQVL